MKKTVLSVLICFLVSFAFGQDDCKTFLKNIQSNALNDFKEASLELTIKITNYYSVPETNNVSQTVEQFKMLVKNDKMHYETSDFENFQDENKMIAVFKANKMIYVYPKPKKQKNQQPTNYLMWQDSLLNNAKLKECINVLEADRKLKKITFIMPTNYANLTLIEEMTVWVDENLKDIIRTAYIYNKQSNIKKVEIEIVKKEKLKEPFLIDTFNLRYFTGKYQGFQLVDNTQKKK